MHTKTKKISLMHKFIIIALIISLSISNFLNIAVYATSAILDSQTEATINKNVKFDTYFNEGNGNTHYLICDVNTTNESMKMNLSVLAGYLKQAKKDRVYECLEFVGLLDKINHYPAQLSGGQKQRVAIARALATNPSVLLCDEPTSSLDSQTTSTILDVLKHVNKELGVTIVIVSHEMDVVKSICHRITMIEQGQILQTVKNEPHDFVISSYDSKTFLQQFKNNERNTTCLK